MKREVKLFFGALVVLLVSFLAINCGNYGAQKTFNGTQVFYTSAVTLNEVEKLGNYLVEEGFADGEHKSVQLNKTGNTYEFRMVVKKGIETDLEYRELGKLIATELSTYVFNGARVDTHFCDEKFKTLIVLPMLTY
ncbi:MAG: hypothetical protein FWD26_02310 [Treponema sp.]|nr:hypothetical protein [Treponema sp.]